MIDAPDTGDDDDRILAAEYVLGLMPAVAELTVKYWMPQKNQGLSYWGLLALANAGACSPASSGPRSSSS